MFSKMTLQIFQNCDMDSQWNSHYIPMRSPQICHNVLAETLILKMVFQTALPLSSQPVLPTVLPGQHFVPTQLRRSRFIGCHASVQRWTDHRLWPGSAAAGDQWGFTSRITGRLWEADWNEEILWRTETETNLYDKKFKLIFKIRKK